MAKYVTDGDGCWLWTGPVDQNGYGHVSIGDRMWIAHRLVYTTLVGPIPDGMEIDHLCRVRHCVNPLHLEPVTHRENTLRGNNPCSLHARQSVCHLGHPLSRIGKRRRCRTCANAANRRYHKRKVTHA